MATKYLFYLLLLQTISFVHSLPTKREASENSITYSTVIDNENLITTTERNVKQYVEQENYTTKKIQASNEQLENNSVQENKEKSKQNEEVENPSRLTLPTLDNFENDKVINSEQYEKVVQPWQTLPYYNIDYYSPNQQDRIMIFYKYRSLFPPINYLPPVSTQIYETIQQNGYGNELGYDDVYYTPTLRPVRAQEDDLMGKLEEEAVVPNVLPIMPYPFFREAVSPYYEVNYGPSELVGLYPYENSNDCAMPFLLNCIPNAGLGSYPDLHNIY